MRSRTTTASGLGSKSLETDRGVVLSPRMELGFDCPAHHHFSVVFSAEASLPVSWDCPTCWAAAARSDGVGGPVEPVKPIRTHWDMLRERRSLAELEALLAERLVLLHSGAIGPGVPEPLAPRTRRVAAQRA